MQKTTKVDPLVLLEILASIEKDKDRIISQLLNQFVSSPTLDTQIDFEMLFDAILERIKKAAP